MALSRNGTQRKSIDWITFSLYLSLVLIGWLMIFAVEYKGEEDFTFSLDNAIGKQTIFLGLAFALMLLLLNIDWKFWRNFAYPIYGLSMALLVAVLIFGNEVNGAKSWFNFMGFSLQPAEIAKFATCLAVAGYLSGPTSKLRSTKDILVVISLFIAPLLLTLIQPDPGSALVFLSFFILLYREGLSPLPYILGLSASAIFILALLFDPLTVSILLMIIGMAALVQNFEFRGYWNLSLVVLLVASLICIGQDLKVQILIINSILLLFFLFLQFIKGRIQVAVMVLGAVVVFSAMSFGTDYVFDNVLEPHHQDRINVWLHPEKCDPQGPLYNVLLSKMAIGSGGLSGKGFLQGTLTKLNYVPEQSTDFIFCTVGEEQGFIGSFAIISLFILLMIRLVILAERQRLNLFRQYIYGVVGILFFHFTINIGMTMGLLPIIGIPLPFISAGGSSLLGFTLMIGVLLKFDSQRYLN
ncbi:MAG: rod shape-determining protein RodA [Saprospiraceae bacterium]|nr:rod shape-determining protein RodA [Saprospiraceae bacterium]